MKFYIALFIGVLFVTGCGSSNGSKNNNNQKLGESGIKSDLDVNNSVKYTKVVTIYVHGYHKKGYKSSDTFGNVNYDKILDKFVEFTNLPTMFNFDSESFTNILAITPYYGTKPPPYYTQKDIDEVNEMEKGIPRYAMIISKFAKYVMSETGADGVNIISASMGSLVTRWLIEKDLEHLSSDKKIQKWLSIEGIIKGNYALSKYPFDKSIDSKQMKYSWVKKNLKQDSRYYDDIRIGQISGTDSQTNSIGLNTLLSFSGFKPNDGYQLYEDTYFDNNKYTHSVFHVDHLGIKKDDGAFASVAAFLESNTRVKITLKDVTVDDIHEDVGDAEIVYASKVFSNEVKKRWGLDDAISERVYDSGILKIHKYKNDGDTKAINQVLFDDYVLNGEKDLKINISGYEIDKNNKSSLGEAFKTVPLKNGNYEIVGDDWSGILSVEVIQN